MDAFNAMASEAGFKMFHASIDYTKYVAEYWRGGAKFKGVNRQFVSQFPPGGAAASVAIEWLISYFTPKGVSSAVADKWPKTGEMLQQARRTTDFEQQKALIHDVQRYIVDNMLVIPVGPITESVDLIWKGLHGPGEVQQSPGGLPTELAYTEYWMEKQI